MSGVPSDSGRQPPIQFSGDYATWDEAVAASGGYGAPEILERILAATRAVESGRAAYERDGVTFDRVEHSAPLLACLLYAASIAGNRLHLLDFGGSLGSSYRQNREALRHLDELTWSVVEQPHFVAAGREFEGPELRFFRGMDDCFRERRPSVALLSGVLQCVERPYELLRDVMSRSFDLLILDRTQFFVADLPDRLTVERVSPEIYPASYPSWFLNLRRFRGAVEAGAFEIALELNSWESWCVDGDAAQNKCFLLSRREALAKGRRAGS